MITITTTSGVKIILNSAHIIKVEPSTRSGETRIWMVGGDVIYTSEHIQSIWSLLRDA